MEDFYTSQNESQVKGNITNNYLGCQSEAGSPDSIIYMVTCLIIALSLPLTLVAAYSVFSMVRKDQVTPIYIINVLLSDLIQLCCMIVQVAPCSQSFKVTSYIYYFGVMAGVGFMVCVALERYLVIAWPLWYRFRRTIKVSLVVSVVVWALPLVYIVPAYFKVDFQVEETILATFFLLPYPLLIFFLGGTLKALHASSSVPPQEKRRIVAVLVLVLLIYTLIFLPTAIWSLAEDTRTNDSFNDLSFTLIKFSPLADLFLYVFLKKGAADKFLAILCFNRLESNDISERPL